MTRDELEALLVEARDMWCPPQPTPMDDMIRRLTDALEEQAAVAADARREADSELTALRAMAEAAIEAASWYHHDWHCGVCRQTVEGCDADRVMCSGRILRHALAALDKLRGTGEST